MLCGDDQIGYRRLVVRYTDAEFGDVKPAVATATLTAPDTVVLYDEADLSDDGHFEHRFLLWPIDELTIRCSDVAYKSQSLSGEAYGVAWQEKMSRGQAPASVVEALDSAWDLGWSDISPASNRLRGAHPERWIRFHSLPGSKRYADTDAEYDTILQRHRAVLEELGAEGTLFLISARFAVDNFAAELWAGGNDHPRARYWRTVPPDEWADAPMHVFVSVVDSSSDELDTFLLAVADELVVEAIVGPADLAWLYHPYDGGADVIARSTEERDRLKATFGEWLSSHPDGALISRPRTDCEHPDSN